MLKLEKFIFYLFIFCFAFQTRKIIYQFGGGGFNEWTSIYIYLTDILLLSVFLLFIWRKREERFLKHSFKLVQLKNYGFWLFLFLIISFLSLFFLAQLIFLNPLHFIFINSLPNNASVIW